MWLENETFKCTNKLCDYEVVHSFPQTGMPGMVLDSTGKKKLLCPRCGFKTLALKRPEISPEDCTKIAVELKKYLKERGKQNEKS